MANPEHLEILEQGVKVWNKWREGHRLIKPNLQGANLRVADLQGADLQGANLPIADLWGANLQSADLQEANLQSADLQRADLQKANLQRADLRGANLRGANLREANLREADFQEANLQEADLREANLREADLREANLRGADLQKADISGACLFLTHRDYWHIKNIRCDYVYWDADRKERTPKDRNFRPGEFEERYKWQPLNEFEKLIRRTIEFSEEYFEAGKSILSFFGTILRKEYTDANASVQIKQEGLKVTMIINPADGDRRTIEKYLDDYGLVIRGNMSPEEFCTNPKDAMALRHKLDMAAMEVRHTKELLYSERNQYENRIGTLEEEVRRLGNILELSVNKKEMVKVVVENKPSIGGDRAAIINGNVNGNAVTGNGNKVAGNDSQIGDTADIRGNDVSFSKDRGKATIVKNSQAGIVGDSAEAEGGTEFHSGR